MIQRRTRGTEGQNILGHIPSEQLTNFRECFISIEIQK